MNYSVYSMTLDDDKQCLYVGTSNGLFRLNLKDGSTSHELTPIRLGKCSKNCGVNKVVIKEKDYMWLVNRGCSLSVILKRTLNDLL